MKNYLLIVISLFILLLGSCSPTDPLADPGVKAEITLGYYLSKNYPDFNCLSLSKDGQFFLASINHFWLIDPQSHTGDIALFNVQTGSFIKLLTSEYRNCQFDFACFSPDGKKVAICGSSDDEYNPCVVIMNLADNQTEYIKTNVGVISQVAFTQTGDTLIMLGNSNSLYAWDMKSDKVENLVSNLYITTGTYFHLSVNSQYICVSNSSYILDISKRPVIEKYLYRFTCGDILPDNQRAIITYNNVVSLLQLSDGKVIKSFNDYYLIYHFIVAAGKTGKYFATSYNTGETEFEEQERGIAIWDVATMRVIGKLGIGFDATYLEFNSDDTKLFVTNDANIETYNITYTKTK